MRFVPIKSEAEQAMAAVHRVRERLIAQRTRTINMLRGQMAEFGVVAAPGPQHVKELVAELTEPGSVPEPLRQALLGLVRFMTVLNEQIAVLDKQILAWHRANPCSRRLGTISGIGPIPGLCRGRLWRALWRCGCNSRSALPAVATCRPGSA